MPCVRCPGRQVGLLLRTEESKTQLGNSCAQWLRCTDAAFGHGMPCPYETIRIGQESLLSRSLAKGGII